MIGIALRMLIGDKLKFFALIVGLTFASMMIAQQASIFTGYALRAGAWVRDTAQADLWVMDPQVEVTIDLKRMTDTQLQRVRGIDGVAWAVPMFVGGLNARLPDGTIQTIRLVGLDDGTLTGGPPQIVRGELADLRQDRAVFIDQRDIDRLLAPRRDPSAPKLDIGSRLDLNDNEVRVSGIYSKTPEFFWEPTIYTTYSLAQRIAPPERKMLQYVLVKLAPDADAQAVAASIRESTGMAVYTGPEFARISTWYVLIQTGILINFGITIALGFVIGALVSGLLLWTFVNENARAFAALKAMGTTNGRVAMMVVIQALLAGIIGFGLGVGIAAATGLSVGTGGDLAFQMVWQVPVVAGTAILICCVSAALISLIRVLNLEPATVFK
ncbi:MAG: ABC transporter permease [Phycisphaerales bacterium]|jgi:putative ABC transport system permease protein|nr:ABC transporter permease [Phycisphaerales bacterium]